MTKQILRFLFNRYRTFFYQQVTDEFFAEIPPVVEARALKFSGEKKTAMLTWLNHQAYVVQKSIVMYPEQGERLMGNLLQIKLQYNFINTTKTAELPSEGVEATPMKDHKAKLAKDLAGAASFKRVDATDK